MKRYYFTNLKITKFPQDKVRWKLGIDWKTNIGSDKTKAGSKMKNEEIPPESADAPIPREDQNQERKKSTSGGFF